MGPESYFLELKKYCNVPLIIDYQIEEITYEFFNTEIKTNKWVDFAVWLKIQEKVEQILKQNLENFESEEVLLSNSSVCVLIVKHPSDIRFARIFQFKQSEMQPFMIRINIKQNKTTVKNELIESQTEITAPQFRTNEKTDSATTVEETGSEILTNEYDPLCPKNKSRTASNSKDSTSVVGKTRYELRTHEYNPLSPTTKSPRSSSGLYAKEANFVPYKPSTQIDTTEDNYTLENDPYSPKPIDLSNCTPEIIIDNSDLFSEKDTSNEIPKYKASPILNKSAKSHKTMIGKKSPESENFRKKSRRAPQQQQPNSDIERNRETRSKKRANSQMKESLINSNYGGKKKARKEKELFGSGSEESDFGSDFELDVEFQVKKVKSNSLKIKSSKHKKSKYSTERSNDSDKLILKKSKIEGAYGQNHSGKWLNSGKISRAGKQSKIKSTKNSDLSKDTKEATSSKITELDEIYTTPVKKLTEEERRLKLEQHAKEISAFTELNNQIKQLIKPPLNIDFKALHHIPINKILKSFQQYQPLLDKHFNEYESQKHRHIKRIEGLDHVALITIVNENYQIQMLNCLKENYELANDVPCYTDLFMTLMLPEWILSLFMNEYQLTRENAIQYLKDQEEAKICSQMDNTTFNFSNT